MPPPLPLQLEFLSTTFAANGKRNGVESVIVGVEKGGCGNNNYRHLQFTFVVRTDNASYAQCAF